MTSATPPTTTTTTNNNNDDLIEEFRKSLTALDKTRQALEAEAEAIASQLEAPSGINFDGPPMGIDSPLVDTDGYPRGDVDIYLARSLRGRLAVIKTDHKGLMAQIETTLRQLASLKTKPDDTEEINQRRAPKPKPKFDPITGKWVVKNWDGSLSGIPGGDQRSFDTLEAATTQEEHKALCVAAAAAASEVQLSQPLERLSIDETNALPFARINAVAPHSPAATAGLMEGDLVLRFGSVEHDSHLSTIAEIVPATAEMNGSLTVVVLRGVDRLELTLKPQPWEGRGMLGCHIVPYIA
jgi:26S proteasome non-ATPase regulatory subunit 9